MPINNITSFYIPFKTGVSFSETETITLPQTAQENIYVSADTADYTLDRWGYVSRNESYRIFDAKADKFLPYIKTVYKGPPFLRYPPKVKPWYLLSSVIYSGIVGFDENDKSIVKLRSLRFFLLPVRKEETDPGNFPLLLIVGVGDTWDKNEPIENICLAAALNDNETIFDRSGNLTSPLKLPSISTFMFEGVIFVGINSYTSERYMPIFLFPPKEEKQELCTFNHFPRQEHKGFTLLKVDDNQPVMMTPATASMSPDGQIFNYIIFGPSTTGDFYASPALSKAILRTKSSIQDFLKPDRQGTMICDDGTYPCVASAQFDSRIWFFSKSSTVVLTQLYDKGGETWAPRWYTAPFSGGAAGPDAVCIAWNNLYMISSSGSIDEVARAPQGVDVQRTPVTGTSGLEFFIRAHLNALVSDPSMARAQVAYDEGSNMIRIMLSAQRENDILNREIGYFGELQTQASRFVTLTTKGVTTKRLPLLYAHAGKTFHAVVDTEWSQHKLTKAEEAVGTEATAEYYNPVFHTTFFSIQGEGRFQFIAVIPRIEKQFLNMNLEFTVSYETDEDRIRYCELSATDHISVWDEAKWDEAWWDGQGYSAIIEPIRLGVFGRFLRIGIVANGIKTPYFLKGLSVYAVPAGGVTIDSKFEGGLKNV